MGTKQYKKQLQSRFNQAQNSYDQHCFVQNKICEAALTLLTSYETSFSCVADLACGTGQSTQRLIQTFSYDRLYALDFSVSLLKQAQKKLPKTTHFIVADFDSPVFSAAYFDLIFCNMGFQWSANLGQTLKNWYGQLQTKGWLLFSLPITPNFPELKPHCKWPTLTHAEIIASLQQADFRIIATQPCVDTMQFANAYQALRSLKAIGANYPSSLPVATGLSRAHLETYFFHPQQTQLTYYLGIYLVKKEAR